MKAALIGCTGLVGSTLLSQTSFDELYNSSNIEQIKGRSFRYVVCAGAPAEKWKANQDPDADWKNISRLINSIQEVTAETFVLISTVDVYPKPIGVDESTPINPEEVEPYGKHRYLLEQFVRDNFPRHLIMRLPGLFGRGLKKNFVYDLIHDNCLDYTNLDSIFQFYNLVRLWNDIQTALRNGVRLLNMATEPVSAREVADECGRPGLTNRSKRPPAQYNVRSKYADLYGGRKDYMYDRKTVLEELRDFYTTEKKGHSVG